MPHLVIYVKARRSAAVTPGTVRKTAIAHHASAQGAWHAAIYAAQLVDTPRRCLSSAHRQGAPYQATALEACPKAGPLTQLRRAQVTVSSTHGPGVPVELPSVAQAVGTSATGE